MLQRYLDDSERGQIPEKKNDTARVRAFIATAWSVSPPRWREIAAPVVFHFAGSTTFLSPSAVFDAKPSIGPLLMRGAGLDLPVPPSKNQAFPTTFWDIALGEWYMIRMPKLWRW